MRVQHSKENITIMNSSYLVLLEGSALTNIPIKEGYMYLSDVAFQFRGNTSEQANAVVNYYGK